jgi:hypothetical protein
MSPSALPARRPLAAATALLAVLALSGPSSAQQLAEESQPAGPVRPPRPACLERGELADPACGEEVCAWLARAVLLTGMRPALAYNLAVVARALGDDGAALDAVLRCVAEAAEQPAAAARCRAVVRELAPRVGFLEVVLDPSFAGAADARVTLGPVAACSQRLRRLEWSRADSGRRVPMTPGRYRLTMHDAQGTRCEREVEVHAGHLARVVVRSAP